MHRLTEREIQILRLVAAGRTTKEIAFTLFRSESVIRKHRANIMRKLDIHTVAELAIYYSFELYKGE
jgi:DNA-binding NarL/FixJ family response regulator